ncbi:hypothetical protein OQA88_5475 [Cercophora sp. LCS_1]
MSATTKTLQQLLDELPNTTMTGSCHCGAVKFKLQHPGLERHPTCQVPASNCNCSICLKNGYLTIHPNREDIEWLSGWDEMKNYRFGSKSRDHKFCGTCGSSACIDFLGLWHVGDVIGINVRLLDGVDVDNLNLRKRNGKED